MISKPSSGHNIIRARIIRTTIIRATMHLLKGILIAAFVAFLAAPSWALTDRQVKEAVEDELDEVLTKDNRPGGAAVVVRIDGRTLFFNFGTVTRGKVITSDTLFNLASIGKTFDATLLS